MAELPQGVTPERAWKAPLVAPKMIMQSTVVTKLGAQARSMRLPPKAIAMTAKSCGARGESARPATLRLANRAPAAEAR